MMVYNNKPNITNLKSNIVKCNIYPQYIRAGAGTGKTETLVQKIVYILENDIKASLENMAIISFTNKACDELKQRISLILYDKSNLYYKAGNITIADKLRKEVYLTHISNISTIHSFCESLLREFGTIIGLSPNYKSCIYTKNLNEFIETIVGNLYRNNEVACINEKDMISCILAIYKSNNNKGISYVNNTYRDIHTKLGIIRRTFIDIYNQLISEIEGFNIKENTLSLNDSLCKSVELLKNKDCRIKIKNKYRYVFIDEYQDTNIPQFELTRELIEIGVNVFLVGDERQAIYGFRGSDINNSKMMGEYIKNINNKDILLRENFRSDPELINEINKIFIGDIYYKDVKLNFDNTSLLIPSKNRNSEKRPVWTSYGKNIVELINDLKESKTLNGKPLTYNDIAILCRTNYLVDNIGEACKQANIPVEVVGGHGFYKTKEIIDMYRFLNYIIYRRKEYKKELYITDIYKSFVCYNGGNFDLFLDNLCRSAKGTSVETVLDYLLDITHIEQFYFQKGMFQAIANISKLKSVAYDKSKSSFMSTIGFLEYITLKITYETEEDEAPVSDENRKKGVVSIYTIHKAKGLSFPIVIISNMDATLINPNKFPKAIMKCKDGKTAIGFSEKIIGMKDIQYKKLLDQHIIDMLEEELRILYVACTRAKHMLVFSCEKEKINPKSTNWINWVNKSLNNKRE